MRRACVASVTAAINAGAPACGSRVQVVIALIVTPEGFPLAYEVLPGNTTDKTTLKDFLAKIEDQYGKADCIWVMDRGILAPRGRRADG